MNTRNTDDQWIWLIWMCISFKWFALSHSGAASINPTPHLRPTAPESCKKVVRILPAFQSSLSPQDYQSSHRPGDVWQAHLVITVMSSNRCAKFWNAKLWIQSDSGMLCFQASASVFACPLLSLVQIWVKKGGPVHSLCPAGVSCYFNMPFYADSQKTYCS